MIVQLKHNEPAGLSSEQLAQIQRQVQYHLTAPPSEEVSLGGQLTLQLSILPGVTRPMSSKGIAQWLWRERQTYRDKQVLDVGTGCGIQGITALLGGAASADMIDVSEAAVACTRANVQALGIDDRSSIYQSDLLAAVPHSKRFDLVVFSHPYFSGIPLHGHQFTGGMLDPRCLLEEFLTGVRSVLAPGGRVVLMGWKFASAKNDPEHMLAQSQMKVLSKELYFDWSGIQQGEFYILVLGGQ